MVQANNHSFSARRGYSFRIHCPMHISTAFQLVAYPLVLFAICVTCHGELARLKPNQAELTYFCTAVATGGALGGIFVVLVAPLTFPRILGV